MKDVRSELHDAKSIIVEVKENAEKIAGGVSSWALGILPTGPWGISWPLLLLCPTLTVALVGYGIPASYTRNLGLLITG
jgi:hypothetical protein